MIPAKGSRAFSQLSLSALQRRNCLFGSVSVVPRRSSGSYCSLVCRSQVIETRTKYVNATALVEVSFEKPEERRKKAKVAKKAEKRPSEGFLFQETKGLQGRNCVSKKATLLGLVYYDIRLRRKSPLITRIR